MAAALALAAIAFWAGRHVLEAARATSLQDYLYTHWLFLLSFLAFSLTIWLAFREKPFAGQAVQPQHVVAVVPAYNEDPAVLQACIRSIALQSRRPQEIYVIDDGSTAADYAIVRHRFERVADGLGILVHWVRQANSGKRHAQAVAFSEATQATIFVTVDSDSILDPRAIEELLKPFADPCIQSVAGIVLAQNNRTNLLARITDLLFVTGQLVDRSMMSRLGSVLVNSGGLAAYRAELVRDNLHAYLHESFFGKHVEFSDDSMLTLFALQRGKTVQQPSAFVFTMMPDRLSHHLRQQVRWMKGSFIRSWWRLKYLPLNSFGFLRQAFGWAQFVMATTLLVLLVVVRPLVYHGVLPYFIVVSLVIGYAQTLRYFSVKRSDESVWSQFLTYLMTPLAVLWSAFVLRPIRLYGALACLQTGWGTRKKVEVALAGVQQCVSAWPGRQTVREVLGYQRRPVAEPTQRPILYTARAW